VGSGSLDPQPQVDGGSEGESDTDAGSKETDPGELAVALSAGANLDLGGSHVLKATLSSIDGFAGTVTLSTLSAPEGWTITLVPDTPVVLEAGGQAEVDITVDIATDGLAGAQDVAINATSELGVVTKTASFQVANIATMVFENGTGGGSHDYVPMQNRLGTTLRFLNLDTGAAHRIHAPGDYTPLGFPHQDGQMAAAPAVGADGGSYEVTINSAGSYDQWYCHEHEGGGGTAVTVIE